MSPLDRMDLEHYPFPKRYDYQSFNLRNTYGSFYAPGAAVNFSTHVLFNSSTGPTVLVLRNYSWTGGGTTTPTGFWAQRGALGAHLGTEHPVWLGESAGAGQHYWLDSATFTPPWIMTGSAASFTLNGTNQVPVFVLPPQWALVWQSNTAALTVSFSFIWEELPIEDPWLGVIGAR